MKNKLLGVVLCGGESKRMGQDKGLLLKDGKAWAVQAADKLAEQGLEAAVSINAAQLQRYGSIFPGYPLIQDLGRAAGPLDGLLSVHEQYPDHDLLLMACDMIQMDKDTLARLIENYQSKPGFEYYVCRHEGFTEPFCAVYTAKALSSVNTALEKGTLKRFSLHERFEMGNTCYLEIKDISVFENFNQPL